VATCRLQRGARTTLIVDASTAAVPPDGQQERGFLQKVQKSIRDFGFGKRSFVEGGVGLFVFTGIGESNTELCTLSGFVSRTSPDEIC
jgi:hypothetical protein